MATEIDLVYGQQLRHQQLGCIASFASRCSTFAMRAIAEKVKLF